MCRTSFEVADVLRRHLADYLGAHHLSLQQYKAAQAIMHCRTAALGGHVDACTACGHWVVSYNSRGNRHCPKCQWSAQQRWIKNRMEELLPGNLLPFGFYTARWPEPRGDEQRGKVVWLAVPRRLGNA
jgi:hypothetical protein